MACKDNFAMGRSSTDERGLHDGQCCCSFSSLCTLFGTSGVLLYTISMLRLHLTSCGVQAREVDVNEGRLVTSGVELIRRLTFFLSCGTMKCLRCYLSVEFGESFCEHSFPWLSEMAQLVRFFVTLDMCAFTHEQSGTPQFPSFCDL